MRINEEENTWVKGFNSRRIDTSKVNSVTVSSDKSYAMDNIQFNPMHDVTSIPKFNNYATPVPIPNTPMIIMTPQLKKQIEDLRDGKPEERKNHSHYFKDVSNLKSIDVYKVLQLFEVTDQALGHAIKKLLVAGGRGAGKSIEKDIQEAIDTLVRCLEIKREVNAQ